MPEINTYEEASQHPEMTQALEGYLDKEFSSENMAFLRAVQDLQTKAANPATDLTALRQQAAGIYDHYGKADSSRQINLKQENLKTMEAGIAGLNTATPQQISAMFAGSHKEIQGLMSSDTFERFKRTPEFEATKLKIDTNAAEQTRIDGLRRQADLARRNPTLGDRMKAAVGSPTTAQQLDAQANLAQTTLDQSRTLKPLDVPQVNSGTVIASATILSQQAQAAALAKAQRDAQDMAAARVAREAREAAEKVPVVTPPLAPQQPKVVLAETPQPEVQVAEIQQIPRGPQRPPPPRPDARQPDPPAPQVQEQEQDELDGQQLDGVGMENMDDIGQVQTRARGQGLDGSEQPQTRARSVRDALGPPSPPKQGQGGPKVGGGGVK